MVARAAREIRPGMQATVELLDLEPAAVEHLEEACRLDPSRPE